MSLRDTWYDIKVELKAWSIKRTEDKIKGLTFKYSKKGPLNLAIEFSQEGSNLQQKLITQQEKLRQLKLKRDRLEPSRSF